ncbi:hypothetical protein NMY22_g10504 [Coprinellus aureogranulatus]|nr:hypothetical protein NMY22_g10504 [Coprinellus aureogranulatus]
MSASDSTTRVRTRSRARAEAEAASPALVPAPAPEPAQTKAAAGGGRSRTRTKSSGANQTKTPAPAKARTRTKSGPTTPGPAQPSQDGTAPARRVTRASTVAAKAADTSTQAVPAQVPTKKRTTAARPTAGKRQVRLRERVTTAAAAAASGDTTALRARTRSMVEDTREVRAKTPTPPCDVPQTEPVRGLQTPTQASTATTDSTNVDSSLGSTPMGPTTANCAANADLDALKAAFMEEIGDHIERADESFIKEMYLDLASDTEIEAAFKKIGFNPNAPYKDGLTGCWTGLPENPVHEKDIYQPFVKVFAAILRHLASTDKRNTRKVVDTSQVAFQHSDNAAHLTKPDFAIIATGPSFELPHAKHALASTTMGYTNVAAVFDGKKDRSRGGHKAHIQQMGVYSRQILIQQPNRKYVRTAVFTEHSVRLLHFDRSGVKFSPWINIHQDPYTFVRLVLGLGSTQEELLGLDTNVQWTIKKGQKVAGTVKMVDSEGEDLTFDLIDVHPVFIRAALRGRGTTCWHAHHRAETKDFRGSQSHEQGKFHNRIWLRVVLKQYGRSLRHFTSELQAICALRDTLYAHCKLFEDKLVLHRDVSMQNILLGKPDAFPGTRGILIDFDMAVKADPRPISSIQVDCRTGTRLYQSLSVLDSYAADSKATAHDYLDDLESYLYVLTHLMYGWAGPGQEITPRPSFLLDWDNETPRIALGLKKLFIVTDIDFAGVAPFWGKACRELLTSFHEFIDDVAREKLKIIKIENPEERLNRLKKLHENRKEHYDTVKGLFDKAIAQLEQQPERATRGLALFEGSPPSPRISNKRASNEDDILDFETPSKRNRTVAYQGSRFSKPLDVENQTVRT